jgi:hypothetical protein
LAMLVGLLEACRTRYVVDVLAKDPRSYRLKAQGSVLFTVVAATPVRVVAATGTVLLMPITRVDDVTHIVGITDAVMDGWGPIPHSSLV